MERKKQFMLSQKSTMKTKLEKMYLQERISYGYKKVITMMLVSGLISIIAIGILFANMMNYVYSHIPAVQNSPLRNARSPLAREHPMQLPNNPLESLAKCLETPRYVQAVHLPQHSRDTPIYAQVQK